MRSTQLLKMGKRNSYNNNNSNSSNYNKQQNKARTMSSIKEKCRLNK